MIHKDLAPDKPIRVSGWGLYHTATNEPVRSGECVYNESYGTRYCITVTNGTPPNDEHRRGRVWCTTHAEEFPPSSYGLKWLKLDSEGNPLP